MVVVTVQKFEIINTVECRKESGFDVSARSSCPLGCFGRTGQLRKEVSCSLPLVSRSKHLFDNFQFPENYQIINDHCYRSLNSGLSFL